MAENPPSSSPNKPLQPPPSSSSAADPPNPQSALSSPQMPPPSPSPSPSTSTAGGGGVAGDHLPHISSPQLHPQQSPSLSVQSQQQQQQLQQLQQQQQQIQNSQQQQNMTAAAASSPGFQIQPNMQRSGPMQRLTQLQQQFGSSATANLMRQQLLNAGQMNFGGGGAGGSVGGAQLQQQMASRSGMIGQAGQLPVLSGQTSQHFNIQSQMLAQSRQKGLVQGGQFHAGNSSGQALQGMQTMGMMSSLGLNSQLRANGPLSYGQQRFPQGQLRQQQQQQLLQQTVLSSSQQKLPSQSLPRTSSVAALNSHISNLNQNGQPAALSQQQQQQWLKHLQPSMTGPVSPSYHLQQQQRQQQAFLPQQLSPSQLHQKSMGLTQQQITQLLQQQQQQPQLNAQQQQQNLIHQQQQLQQMQQLQQHQQQLLSSRVPGASVQKSISLTSSQPETPGTTLTGGSSSQGTEATNQLLGKRKIRDLVAQVDPHGELDPEVEDLLLEIADDFIDSVTTFACDLAKHRKSSTLEAKDVLLHLEKNWHLAIPGFTKEEQNLNGNSLPVDAHNRRLKIIQEMVESQTSDRDAGGGKSTNKQIINDLASGSVKPSSGSEQIGLPAVGSQMLQKVHQF